MGMTYYYYTVAVCNVRLLIRRDDIIIIVDFVAVVITIILYVAKHLTMIRNYGRVECFFCFQTNLVQRKKKTSNIE